MERKREEEQAEKNLSFYSNTRRLLHRRMAQKNIFNRRLWQCENPDIYIYIYTVYIYEGMPPLTDFTNR